MHGVRVPAEIIEHPDQITIGTINEQPNAEIRRVMVDLYGADRYLVDAGAKLIHSDKCGKLWHTNMDGDEPLVMVEVINSTPEPDGSYRHYLLRVPPTMQRARQAVAWTFEMDEKDYLPVYQS